MIKRSFSWIYIPIGLLIAGGVITLGAAVYLLLNESATVARPEQQTQSNEDLQRITPTNVLEPSSTASILITPPANQSNPEATINEGLMTPDPSSASATTTPQPISITLIDGENQRVLETNRENVGDVLLAAGVETGKTAPPEAEKMGKLLLEDVRRHAGGHPQSDDITIMTFGRNP